MTNRFEGHNDSLHGKTVSPAGNLMTILVSVWLVSGVFVDGWAHSNPELVKLESFFSPWHGILYSGFAVCAVWIGLLIMKNKSKGQRWRDAIPQGYGLGIAGVAIFLAGGLGDMIWHILFGIEEDLEALLSPTHLTLFIGGVLIVSSPFRAAWGEPEEAPTLKRFFPALLSITFSASFAGFFLMYMWALNKIMATSRAYDHYHTIIPPAEFQAVWGIVQEKGMANILLTTMVLMFPLLLMLIRWRIPFGSAAILFSVLAFLMSVLSGFSLYENIFVAFAAGLITDFLVLKLQAGPGQTRSIRIISFVSPFILWFLYFSVQHMTIGLSWSPDLWIGSIVLSGLSSLALSILALPPSKNMNQGSRTIAE